MGVKMKPASYIVARLGLEPNGRVHKFFTSECARQMDRFVPFDKGTLAETVVKDGRINPVNVTVNTIVYNQPYAKVVYFGIRKGKPITIHKTKHRDATTYWDKHMWSAKKDDIVRAVQKYINSGGKYGS